MKVFGINALGQDGRVYALTFECEDIIDVEMMIHQTGLNVDPYGYGELVSVATALLDLEVEDGSEH